MATDSTVNYSRMEPPPSCCKKHLFYLQSYQKVDRILLGAMEDEKWPSAFLVSDLEKQIWWAFLLSEKQVERFVKVHFSTSLLMLTDEKWPFAFLLSE